MTKLFIIATMAAAFATAYSHVVPSQIDTEAFIQSINEKATTWTARKNFEGRTPEQLKALADVIGINRDPNVTLPVVFHEAISGIPDSFDAREQWPFCESIRTIRDEGACGSCWAFAAVEVMSDRLCLASEGRKKFIFSAEEVVSCCTACGGGCRGGFLNEPYKYWVTNGIPSGGDYGSKLGCKPYTAAVSGETPQCQKACVSGYEKSWEKDLRHATSAYQVNGGVLQIQREILDNGPVTAYMEVYEDFYSYGTGIYQHTSGSFVGGHAVKIIGWGSENDVPYWIAANSWGTGFGEDGFFRILRGSNCAGIESYIVAGYPNTSEV
uniref:Cathepsin B n=1 Tax=Apriona germarii TaxID=157307 RepID=Q8T659_APRGE|nr:cathepsin B [Apriona germarii]